MRPRDIMSTKNATNECDKVTVYYDGGCPLCRREINFYRGMRGAEEIAWQDVSGYSTEQIAPDLSRRSAMRRFHVRRGDGTLVSGALAFAELWRALPSLFWAGRAAALPGVRHIAELAYRTFLLLRPLLQRSTPR